MSGFPPYQVKFGDRVVTVTPERIDLIRVERLEQKSSSRIDFGLDFVYKLLWLALQRLKDPGVAPIIDLSEASRSQIMAGVDALIQVAEVEVVEESDEGNALGA